MSVSRRYIPFIRLDKSEQKYSKSKKTLSAICHSKRREITFLIYPKGISFDILVPKAFKSVSFKNFGSKIVKSLQSCQKQKTRISINFCQ